MVFSKLLAVFELDLKTTGFVVVAMNRALQITGDMLLLLLLLLVAAATAVAALR
jgi:hypothetical protein